MAKQAGMSHPQPAVHDPAARFYQRNFERMTEDGEADNFTAETAIRGGSHRYSTAFAHLAKVPGQKVLEMGYGGRGIIELLAPYTDEYHVVDIVDRTGSIGLPANVTAYQANLDNPFPFADARFDTLIAMMVIEHMYDPFHAFSEAARVTRPGGDLFINLPTIASVKCRFDLLLGRIPVTSSPDWFAKREWDGNHLHYFTVADVCRLAKLYGLELLALGPVGRLASVKALRPSLLCHEITYHFRRVG
jgi:SAM-dependent methyltransferase